MLEINSSVVAARAARIHRSSQRLHKNAHWIGRGIYPSKEARVTVAHRVAKNLVRNDVENFIAGNPGITERRLQDRFSLRFLHAPKHGPLWKSFKVRGRQIDGEMTETAELVNVKLHEPSAWHGGAAIVPDARSRPSPDSIHTASARRDFRIRGRNRRCSKCCLPSVTRKLRRRA